MAFISCWVRVRESVPFGKRAVVVEALRFFAKESKLRRVGQNGIFFTLLVGGVDIN